MINLCYNLVKLLNVVGDLYLMSLKYIDPLEVVKSHLMLDSDLYNIQKIEPLCPGVLTLFQVSTLFAVYLGIWILT